MNPIKNKKNLEMTVDEIRNFAYTYIEKYSPSKQQLRIYLFKKLIKISQKKSSKRELFNLIDIVISSLIEQKLINDTYNKQVKEYDQQVKEYNKNNIHSYCFNMVFVIIYINPDKY